MTWKRIAELIGVSERTLRDRMKYFQLQVSTYNHIENETLDDLIKEILHNSPNSGERMVIGALLAKNTKVQRSRVRDALQRIAPNRESLNRRIVRREYNVTSPNTLW